MKKILVSLALLAAVAFSANAQLRIEAVGNLSKLSFDSGSSITDTKSELGYGVRAMYDFLADKECGFDIGLGYMSTKSSNDATKGTITLNNIQLPFHVSSNWDLGTVSIKAYVGFYAGYALSGKTTFDAIVAKADADPFEGEGGMKRFDLGSDDELIVSFGGRYNIGIGYQYGFLNLCKSKDVKIKPEAFFFTLGYTF